MGTSGPDEASTGSERTREQATQIARSVHGDGQPPWVPSPLPLGHLVCTAQRLGCTVGEARDLLADLDLARPLSPWLASRRPEHADLVALSARLDGRPPWIEPPVPLGHLVALAAELDRSLPIAVRRLATWDVPGLPDHAEIEALAAHVDRPLDRRLLSEAIDGHPPWLAAVRPEHVLRASAVFGWPVASVYLRLFVYHRLLDLPQLMPGPAATASVSPDDVRLLSRNLDGRPPWVGPRVSDRQLLRAARALDVSPEAARTRLEALWALWPAERFEVIRAPGAFLREQPAEIRVLASRRLDGRAPWIDGPIPRTHLLRAAHRLGWPVARAWEAAGTLRDAGIPLPPGPPPPPDLWVEDDDLAALERAFEDDAWPSPWDVAVRMLRHAVANGSTMGEARAHLAKFEAAGLDLPSLSPKVAGHRFDLKDLLLVDLPSGRFEADDLVDAAAKVDEPLGAVVERIKRLDAAGLPVSVLWRRCPDLGAARACEELSDLAGVPLDHRASDAQRARAVGCALGALVRQGLEPGAALAAVRSLASLRAAPSLEVLVDAVAQREPERTDLLLVELCCAWSVDVLREATLRDLSEDLGLTPDEVLGRVSLMDTLGLSVARARGDDPGDPP